MGFNEAVNGEAKKAEALAIESLGTVASITDFATLAAQVTAGKMLWFRGARRSSYDLVPSLYRHPTISDPDALIELEWELMSEFRDRSPPFSATIPTSHLELLFLMQHYGIPTRLLDWTENPLIALFFALENARQERAGEETDACVWVLDPINLNSVASSHRVNSDRIFGAYSDDVNGYHPNRDAKAMAMRNPVALYGVHNSPRIVAQRGSFLLFGKDTAPANQQDALVRAGVLRKIVVRGDSKRAMFGDLFNIGVSDSVVYPDLDGLGREIRNRRGF